MRAPSRAVIVAAIVAVAFALNAQENCPPPAEPVLHWVGLVSGCKSEYQFPCIPGETIVFSVTPTGGDSYPGCVTYFWEFGDGGTSTAVSPSHVYVANGFYSVLVRVRGGDVDEFGEKEMVIGNATVIPQIVRFSASATVILRGQTIVLSWVTKHATSVRIDPINVSLDASVTSYSLVPAVTRAYTLTAFGDAGVRYSETPVTVVVSEPRRRAVRH